MLKPFEKNIEELEKTIIDLETELRKVNENMVAASYRADKEAIAELSRSIKELPLQIDTHYAKLDQVFQEHEVRREEFIRRLNELTEQESD
ncbi:MAG: hypothetical protein V1739_09260 [Candidatus Omnitrophota bacterium]